MTIAPWTGDLLDREKDANFLQYFLAKKTEELRSADKQKSYVLNLDAGWGVGKTYFLTNFRDQLRAADYLVAYVDAWADDHAEDPLIAVMSAIYKGIDGDKKLKPAIRKSAKTLMEITGKVVSSSAKGAARQFGHRILGEDAVEQLTELVGAELAKGATAATEKSLEFAIDASGKAMVERFKQSQKSIADFKNKLKSVLSELEGGRKLPLFVLVDELDRCRPTCAVLLLERIKHLFDLPGIVFVMATNTEQLQHSVGALYGAAFDSQRYLYRFFDQTYRFEEPQRMALVTSLLDPASIEKLSAVPYTGATEFIAEAFDACAMPPRDIEQCIEILNNCITAWNQKQPLNLLVLLPLVIAQHKRLHIDFSRSLQETLDRSLGQRNLSSLVVDLAYQRRRPDEVPRAGLWDLFYRFAEHGARGYEELIYADMNSLNAAARFVITTLRNEAKSRAENGNVNPSPSLVLSYPALVRTVGRLVPRTFLAG